MEGVPSNLEESSRKSCTSSRNPRFQPTTRNYESTNASANSRGVRSTFWIIGKALLQLFSSNCTIEQFGRGNCVSQRFFHESCQHIYLDCITPRYFQRRWPQALQAHRISCTHGGCLGISPSSFKNNCPTLLCFLPRIWPCRCRGLTHEKKAPKHQSQLPTQPQDGARNGATVFADSKHRQISGNSNALRIAA